MDFQTERLPHCATSAEPGVLHSLTAHAGLPSFSDNHLLILFLYLVCVLTHRGGMTFVTASSPSCCLNSNCILCRPRGTGDIQRSLYKRLTTQALFLMSP